MKKDYTRPVAWGIILITAMILLVRVFQILTT
jgi:hypothetical protein